MRHEQVKTAFEISQNPAQIRCPQDGKIIIFGHPCGLGQTRNAPSFGGLLSGLAGLATALIALKSVDMTKKQMKATIISEIRNDFADPKFRGPYIFLSKWGKEQKASDSDWYKKINLNEQTDINTARGITAQYFTKIGAHYENKTLDAKTIRTTVSKHQVEFLICILHPLQTRLPEYDYDSPYSSSLRAICSAWPELVEDYRSSNPILYDNYITR